MDEARLANPEGMLPRRFPFDAADGEIAGGNPDPAAKKVLASGVRLGFEDMSIQERVIAFMGEGVVSRADLGGLPRRGTGVRELSLNHGREDPPVDGSRTAALQHTELFSLG